MDKKIYWNEPRPMCLTVVSDEEFSETMSEMPQDI